MLVIVFVVVLIVLCVTFVVSSRSCAIVRFVCFVVLMWCLSSVGSLCIVVVVLWIVRVCLIEVCCNSVLLMLNRSRSGGFRVC